MGSIVCETAWQRREFEFSTMVVNIKKCLTRAAVRGAQRGVAQRGAADAQYPRGSGGQLAPGGVRGNAPLIREFRALETP